MLDIVKLHDETNERMLKFFKIYQLANNMEPTDSQKSDLPSAYLLPLTSDLRAPNVLYDQINDQAKDEVFGVMIIATVEQLSLARDHVNDVFRSHIHQPEEKNIPFHEALYVGGELRNIKSNTYTWMEMYKTYTLGGC